MEKIFNVLLGTLCFSLPIVIAAILGTRFRHKAIAKISRNRKEGRYDNWDDPLLAKRLKLMGFAQFIMIIMEVICILLIFIYPSGSVGSIVVSIMIIIIPVTFVLGLILERRIIKGK